MNTLQGRSHRSHISLAQFESLEGRRLLSTSMPLGRLTDTVTAPVPTAGITATNTILYGTTIHAETGQAFRAVIGTIRGLHLPTGYTLNGLINWGDGSATSAAQFAPQPNGMVDVLGAHTYETVGMDDISVTVTATPPGPSLVVLLVGSFHSKAYVIAPNGGVTLNEIAGVPFTANLGTFHSNLSSLDMTALITWGDGTQSIGKIIALPTTGPIGGFAVYGSHAYGSTGSYPVHITVLILPRPVAVVGTAATTTAPAIFITLIDSVIDVLPPLSTAAD